MKKLTMILALIFVAAGALVAADAPKADKNSTTMDKVPAQQSRREALQSWLRDLKKKIASAQPANKKSQPVSVAAVRGDETSEGAPLYWKGVKGSSQTSAAELKAFDEAIDAALGSDSVAAKGKLQSFLTAYPKSPMASDAQQALKRLEGI